MKKNIFIIISFMVLLGMLSCEDTRLDNITSPKILIPQSGEVEQVIYNTGEPYVYKLGVYQTGVNPVNAGATVNIMSQAELDVYNKENGTSYKRLPDNCFKLVGGGSSQTINFLSGARLEYVGIDINYVEIAKLFGSMDEQTVAMYVIPISVTQVNIDVNKNKLNSFIKPVIKTPYLYFKESDDTKISIEAGSNTAYKAELNVMANFDNQWDITAALAVNEALVSEYNTANKTSMKLLPVASYAIAPNPIALAKGKKSATVTITLQQEKLDYDDFLLPLAISKPSKFEADPEKGIHYIVVSKPAARLDRTGWSIAGFSSEEPSGEGAGNGVAACVLDGNPATFWHSQWSGGTGQLPHFFTIDMKKEYLVTSVDLQRRPNQRDTKGGNFYISSDNVTFTQIGTFQMAEVNEAQTFKVTSTRGRYLKVEITESRRAPFANMGEVYVRGVQ